MSNFPTVVQWDPTEERYHILVLKTRLANWLQHLIIYYCFLYKLSMCTLVGALSGEEKEKKKDNPYMTSKGHGLCH